MTEPVRSETEGGIATITLDNPPVNALGAGLRAGLMDALAAALGDPGVRVIILVAAGRTWPAGADIREFGKPPVPPILPEICAALAASAKPVIAALHGSALGGGLELAIAAGVRIAEAGTKLGFPEVTLGVLPGAGGTQRLPRLIGAKAALAMMLGGQPVSAARAAELGLVDAVTEGAALDAARELAEVHLAGGAELPTAAERLAAGGRDAPGWLAAVTEARAGLGDPRLPAPGRIVDCVEAALLLPEAEAYAFERSAFLELVSTPQAAALRHAFFSEKHAARQPDLDAVTAREVTRLGLAGGGAEGATLAAQALAAGLGVTLLEEDSAALARAVDAVGVLIVRQVVAGRLTPEAQAEQLTRLVATAVPSDLAEADMIVVAGPEDDERRRALFAELGAVARPGAIIAAGAAADLSAAGLAAVAAMTGRPADVIGLATDAPLPPGRLMEIVTGEDTDPAAAAAALALARRLRRTAVRTAGGTIGARLLAACRAATLPLAGEGAADQALRDFGFARGPGEMSGAAPVAQAAPPSAAAEIQRRALAAMANEGAWLIGEGVARCPSDVDVVMLAGYGFPRWRGGPMQAADQAGLLMLRDDLRRLAGEAAGLRAPAPLWDELIKNGRKFADLNAG